MRRIRSRLELNLQDGQHLHGVRQRHVERAPLPLRLLRDAIGDPEAPGPDVRVSHARAGARSHRVSLFGSQTGVHYV